MRARFLGKDPQSGKDGSPTLFATDRTDRETFLVQGWKVTDSAALSDVGTVPGHEDIVEVPVEILEMYLEHKAKQAQ
ncbi:hypothetical protein C8K30_101470 [Promicromonospora sp. AC04]|jgi:hypothetical protein|uniref:Uncharacterized protein n=1 Tax=Promicromonospora vindobonensis TaxID=195748 RepID=A0ABW5VXX0_9MICO|nr:hypothetical protein [Promicromonospora sp. AC04]PUB31950.1 hypothetical protein C8K30_101470 [Promicromonospora sp. AC04]